MKITIEYDPYEDSYEYEKFKIIDRMYTALYELDQWARTELKHGEPDEKEEKMYERIREFTYDSGIQEVQ